MRSNSTYPRATLTLNISAAEWQRRSAQFVPPRRTTSEGTDGCSWST